MHLLSLFSAIHVQQAHTIRIHLLPLALAAHLEASALQAASPPPCVPMAHMHWEALKHAQCALLDTLAHPPVPHPHHAHQANTVCQEAWHVAHALLAHTLQAIRPHHAVHVRLAIIILCLDQQHAQRVLQVHIAPWLMLLQFCVRLVKIQTLAKPHALVAHPDTNAPMVHRLSHAAWVNTLSTAAACHALQAIRAPIPSFPLRLVPLDTIHWAEPLTARHARLDTHVPAPVCPLSHALLAHTAAHCPLLAPTVSVEHTALLRLGHASTVPQVQHALQLLEALSLALQAHTHKALHLLAVRVWLAHIQAQALRRVRSVLLAQCVPLLPLLLLPVASDTTRLVESSLRAQPVRLDPIALHRLLHPKRVLQARIRSAQQSCALHALLDLHAPRQQHRPHPAQLACMHWTTRRCAPNAPLDTAVPAALVWWHAVQAGIQVQAMEHAQPAPTATNALSQPKPLQSVPAATIAWTHTPHASPALLGQCALHHQLLQLLVRLAPMPWLRLWSVSHVLLAMRALSHQHLLWPALLAPIVMAHRQHARAVLLVGHARQHQIAASIRCVCQAHTLLVI